MYDVADKKRAESVAVICSNSQIIITLEADQNQDRLAKNMKMTRG